MYVYTPAPIAPKALSSQLLISTVSATLASDFLFCTIPFDNESASCFLSEGREETESSNS